MRSKNRTTRAVKETIRAFKDIEDHFTPKGILNPYGSFTEPGYTPQMQQLRSNRCGSRFYQKICPGYPMAASEIAKAFRAKKNKF